MKQHIAIGDFKIDALGRKYLNQVINSNRLSYGRISRCFEEEFSKKHGAKHAVFCNSGTSALHVALQAMKEEYGWADGDEVIIPMVTFVATANIVLHNRMKPVFIDLENIYSNNTYNVNSCEIQRLITKKTRAIIFVSILGFNISDGCYEVAKKNNIKIINDFCEAMFIKHHCVDISCYSTYMAHHIVTGVGGMAITDNKILELRMRSLINHGRDKKYLNIDDDDKNPLGAIRHRFNFVSQGHSFRATELEAAIGLAQMARYEQIRERRIQICKYIAKCFGHPGRDIPLMGFPFSHTNKKDIIQHLEKHGIETRDIPNLLYQPCYRGLFDRAKFPRAAHVHRNEFYIPCHQYLTNKDVVYMTNKIKEFK